MGKANGKSESKSAGLDLERELPPGDGNEITIPEAAGEAPAPESELQKVKAERDSLLDRLARAQAEFDNARKRASKEQQEYRDYAVADAIKSFLPAMDSLERALQVQSDAAELRGGIELIYKQLLAAL